MAGQLSYAIMQAIAVHNGEGRHIIFLKSTKVFIQIYVAACVSYSFTVMMTKISVLLYYNRIFPIRWLRTTSFIVGGVVIAYDLAVVFIAALECIPLSSMWTGKPGRCIDTKGPFTALAIINVLTDVAILALPVKPVLNLNMRLGRKIQVLSIFLLGGVVCVFGILRAHALATVSDVDISWNATYSGVWSYIEISVGIVAACLPTLGPLFHKPKTRNPADYYIGLKSWKYTMNASTVSKDAPQDGIRLTYDITCEESPSDPVHNQSRSTSAPHGLPC
ncbi:hypothetical protein BO78DRAFT_398983 [Aspergillus sclerotiicarbonarius CBS 121057]|uniref:Rhodopsin domain-containing protein n=1 Tax=Aspergillus sclerotiicarbonarius (strain CBS 121057 / IBT 28362) TaxID=1448318 RepID=A0A319FD78_ASPSB|nr:hypothetical protein BO78DRAFT_398983 [Aspergillus sclerotiicarbonarius CBS 121057]